MKKKQLRCNPCDINGQEEIHRLPQTVLDRFKNPKRPRKKHKYEQSVPSRYRSYIMRANRRQISFELTVEEFVALCSGTCVYCGTTSKIGVDRKDSGEGYTLDNCQPCCGTCNMMKFTATHEAFIGQVRRIVRHCG